MIVLDTNHLTTLQYAESDAAVKLAERLEALPEGEVATTIVSFEEQMRGWLAAIHSRKSVADQVPLYGRLELLLRFFGSWRVLGFDEAAATEFERLRKQRLRLGTMDLKIAAIVLAHGASLLSRNLRDFRKVPGLRVEDWTVEQAEPAP